MAVNRDNAKKNKPAENKGSKGRKETPKPAKKGIIKPRKG